MKDQGEPIADDEWLLRRVHLDNFDSLDPPSIGPYAFKPTVKGNFIDDTGISFYRQSCIDRVNDVLVKADSAKRAKYGVVRLPVDFLRSIGLRVIRDDDKHEPIVLGHVVMPEINSGIYTSDKNGVLPKMKALSDFVNTHGEFLAVPQRTVR